MSDLTPYGSSRASVGDSLVSWSVARRTQRALDAVEGHHQITLSQIRSAAEEATAVVHARNAVAAAAAQDDAVLSGILNALPIYDAQDADFRAQLKQATRSGVIGDVLGFGR
jgi:hypothetical protein